MSEGGRLLRLILHGDVAGDRELREAITDVRGRGHRIEVRVTWERGDAERLAREAVEDGVETVIAGGGDGTLNEVISGLVDGDGDTRPAVGVLPLGTANDFADACGIPVDDAMGALDVVLRQPARPIDIAHMNGRPFVNMATGGFGSEVTAETPPELKRAVGSLSYLLTGFRRFNEFSARRGSARGPGFEWEGEFLVLAVGNGRQAGGGIALCPEALIDDGMLDIVILPATPESARLDTLLALLKAGMAGLEAEVVRRRLPWLEVSTPGSLHVNLDGEPADGDSFRFEIEPAALRMHLPRSELLARPA